MNEKRIELQNLTVFKDYLVREEKSMATVEKYLRDVRAFFVYMGKREVTKELVIAYKHYLEEQGFAVRSINSMLASVNAFLKFMGWNDYVVKNVRVQRQTYCAEEKELSKTEYAKLLEAARGKQIELIMQTICSTGIRISELQYFTIEAIKKGKVVIHCKGKIRTILIPGKLRKLLLAYGKKKNIKKGPVLITKNGKPVDRSNVWKMMKKISVKAGVQVSKVFPHNLRKLFAKTFYKNEKDIAKLADILGHGSIETTRIYIMTSGVEHRRRIERLGLVI